jgi:hypothetical protein
LWIPLSGEPSAVALCAIRFLPELATRGYFTGATKLFAELHPTGKLSASELAHQVAAFQENLTLRALVNRGLPTVMIEDGQHDLVLAKLVAEREKAASDCLREAAEAARVGVDESAKLLTPQSISAWCDSVG